MSGYVELLDLLKRRTSCRSFTSEEVSEDDIRKIVEAGMWTASAHNLQSSKIIRIKDQRLKSALRIKTSMIMSGNNRFDPFYGAKELFIVVANGNCAEYDGSLTLGNMMLAAESLGLGSCWINTAQLETSEKFSVIREICRELGLSEDFVGIGYLIVGHKKCESLMKERYKDRFFEI